MSYGFTGFDDRLLAFFEPLRDRAPQLLRTAARLEDVAASGQDTDALVASVRRGLGGGDKLAELASLVLLNAYGDRESAPSGDRVMDAFEDLGGATASLVLPLTHPFVDDLYLYFLWIGQPLTSTLQAGPVFLDRYSESMVDTLVDDGRFPEEWKLRLLESSRAPYLRGRVDIDDMDDDELIEAEAWSELARRVDTGRSDPERLPAAVRDRLAGLASPRTDDAALLRLAEASGLDTAAIESALAGDLVPGWCSIGDHSILNLLIERCELRVPGFDTAPLDADQKSFLSYVGLQNAKAALFDWDWKRALTEGGAVMGFAQDEWVRQEAACLCAAAHLQLGRPDRAHATLDRVWDDPKTINAAINHAVAAIATDHHERAVEALCLAAEPLSTEHATTLGLRTACVAEATWSARAAGFTSERLAKNLDDLEEAANGRLPAAIRDFLDGRTPTTERPELDLRNAYLMFGRNFDSDFELPMDQVYESYPRLRRRIREAEDPPFTLEDLDWALGFLEHQRHNVDRTSQVVRVPTNPNAYQYGSAGNETGVLTDQPRPLPRRTTADHEPFSEVKGRVWSGVSALHLTRLAA